MKESRVGRSGGRLGLGGNRIVHPALQHLAMLGSELLDATLADPVSEPDGPAAPRHHAIPEGMPVIVGVPRTPTNHHERLSRCTSGMSRKKRAMPMPFHDRTPTHLYEASLHGETRKITGEREKPFIPAGHPPYGRPICSRLMRAPALPRLS